MLYFDPHDPASLAALLHEVTAGPHAAARREVLKQRARSRLAFHRWEANAEILLDRLIAVGAIAAGDDDTMATLPGLRPAAPTAGQ